MRVVIVEDHELFRESLACLLGSQPDIEVVGTASYVSGAISVALNEKPDVMLLDLGLPDGEGLEVITAIRPTLPDIRIVVLTVHDSDEMLFAAIRLGARGYLLKNATVMDLLAALRSLDQGDAAFSHGMVTRVLEEFSRLGSLQGVPQSSLKALTVRELDVLKLLGTGASNHEIARRLFITENTVKAHVHNILDKLGLPSRSKAANFARRNGMSNLSIQAHPVDTGGEEIR
ncbi:MAG TPA: response regulator transcription factor [Anaerolineae bacterium]|nr:response regulator transcription factor [Anaerolineae bacterium]